jgi:hypothetical protein
MLNLRASLYATVLHPEVRDILKIVFRACCAIFRNGCRCGLNGVRQHFLCTHDRDVTFAVSIFEQMVLLDLFSPFRNVDSYQRRHPRARAELKIPLREKAIVWGHVVDMINLGHSAYRFVEASARHVFDRIAKQTDQAALATAV